MSKESRPNLGQSNPSIEIHLPAGEAVDLATQLPNGEPETVYTEQALIATVTGFNSLDPDGDTLGVEGINRVVHLRDLDSGKAAEVDLHNDPLTEDALLARLRSGEYRPDVYPFNHERLRNQKEPRFHLILDNEDHVSLITADQDNAVQATKDPEDIGDVLLNQRPGAVLYEGVGLDTIAQTIDDDAWSLLAAEMKEHIRRNEDLSVAPEKADGRVPLMDNIAPLFSHTPLDLSAQQATDRLSAINEYRPFSVQDMRSAMELMELTVANRYQRPANRGLISEKSWNGPLLEDRHEYPVEDLEAEYADRHEQMERVIDAMQQADSNREPISHDNHLDHAWLYCHLNELESVIEQHPERKAGLSLS